MGGVATSSKGPLRNSPGGHSVNGGVGVAVAAAAVTEFALAAAVLPEKPARTETLVAGLAVVDSAATVLAETPLRAGVRSAAFTGFACPPADAGGACAAAIGATPPTDTTTAVITQRQKVVFKRMIQPATNRVMFRLRTLILKINDS